MRISQCAGEALGPAIRSSSGSSGVPLIALLAGAALIGFAAIFAKWGVRSGQIGPVAAAFWRMALSAPLFWGILAWQRRGSDGRGGSADFLRRPDWRVLCVPGLFFAADLSLWHWSFEFTTLANATLLANFAAVIVSIAGWIWLKERFTGAFVASAACALAGAALLLNASFAMGGRRAWGDALGISTAFFYAGYQLSVKRLRRRHSAVEIMAWSGLASAAVLLVVSVLSGERLMPATGEGWLALCGLAWLAHACGQGLIVYALAHLSASFASVVLVVQPLVTAIAGWILFGEVLTPLQLAGGGILLAGIVLARVGSKPFAARTTVPGGAGNGF